MSDRLFTLETLVLPPFGNNVYLIEMSDRVVVVDPSSNAKTIADKIKEKFPNHKVDIYLTHGHCDHIGAVSDLCKIYPDIKIYCSSKDTPLYTKAEFNMSSFMGKLFDISDCVDRMIYVDKNEDLKVKLGDVEFQVFETPGHTPGGTCLYNAQEKTLITGDTLFQGSIGRSDFPYSNGRDLVTNIITKLIKLPDDVKVYPGHGDSSTIGDERRYNPFLKR